jgi:hypothetical protein
MKAEYFVVAFCFLLTGVFFTYAKRTGWGNHNESSIIISNDNFREEIKYSGKIRFSDDETAIQQITPGGFLDFTRNDEQLVVKCDKQGRMSYQLTENGDTKSATDSSGKQFIADAVKELIGLGIDADERMERIYLHGGNRALMDAFPKLKNDNVKRMYLDKILKSDSLSTGELVQLSEAVAKFMGSDEDKQLVLKAFKAEMLSDSTVAKAYLHAVESLGDDYSKAATLTTMGKANLPVGLFAQILDVTNSIRDENERARILQEIIRKDQLDDRQAALLLEAINRLNDENQKKNLLMELISIKGFAEANWDMLLQSVGQLRDDTQRDMLFVRMMGENDLSEGQWVAFIGQINTIGSNDFEKSNLLIQMVGKMPKNDQVKSAFVKAAKTIRDDSEFGKVMRVLEP